MRNPILKQFKVLQPTGIKELDSQITDLFNAGFFNNYQAFTEQVFLILDQRTMQYLYVSENVKAVTGFDHELVARNGFFQFQDRYHPDDLRKFEKLFAVFAECIQRLSDKEILNSSFTYDYRVRFADEHYHRVLQHTIPLAVDAEKKVTHCLIIASDITAYKKEDYCKYKLVVYDDISFTTVLDGTIGETTSETITNRELEIIKLTAGGFTEKQIADKLFISLQTVKTHRKNLIRKTGVKNSAQLVKYGIANSIV